METLERLIRSTQELLWERGYVGTSPKAIQRLADAGQGSMYHHFTGKAELARAAIERSAAELRDAAEEQFSGPGTATERISDYLERDRDVLRGCRIGRLAELVAEGKRTGEYPESVDPDQLAATIAAVLQGGYVLARAANSTEPFELAVQGLINLLPKVSA